LAISPLSDIVLDVAKAADPLQYTEAVRKLVNIGAPEAAEDSFASLLDSADSLDTETDALAQPALDWTRADLRGRLAPVGTLGVAGHVKTPPYQQFEAFVLQTFVQSMFPKDATHVFGQGIAGSYWSSMLAEEIAGQMAKSGGIGIAKEIAARHPALSGVNPGQGAQFGSVPNFTIPAFLLETDES
jgi:flagellar protein FlgJ